MEWRCEWCGKPHEENDPPCDNCGHGEFERAVVPVAPEGEGEGPTVWVCPSCGREHPRNNPPCSRCGEMTLVKRRQSLDDEPTLEPEPPDGSDDGTTPAMAAAAAGGRGPHVWVCEECGQQHPRNNPPCNQCGGMTFERRELDAEDVPGAGSTGWLDVIQPRDVLLALGALAMLALLVATQLGFVTLPGAAGPSVEDVPGSGETAGSLSLSAVEEEYVAALADERRSRDLSPVGRDDRLSAAAAYHNRRVVLAVYGDAERPAPAATLDRYDVDCDAAEPIATVAVAPAGGNATLSEWGPERTAATLVGAQVRDERGLEDGASRVGVDVHVGPGGRLFATQVVC